MSMRRSPFGMFLMVGAGVLLGAAIFGGSEAALGILAAPFVVLGFIFKVVLFMMLFGFLFKVFGGGHHRRSGGSGRPWPEGRQEQWKQWQAWKGHSHGGRARTAEKPDERPVDHFEEWHRMAHARQEVDDHAPPVEQ